MKNSKMVFSSLALALTLSFSLFFFGLSQNVEVTVKKSVLPWHVLLLLPTLYGSLLLSARYCSGLYLVMFPLLMFLQTEDFVTVGSCSRVILGNFCVLFFCGMLAPFFLLLLLSSSSSNVYHSGSTVPSLPLAYHQSLLSVYEPTAILFRLFCFQN